jgi:tetratricopeptide (TPR) repeat protein
MKAKMNLLTFLGIVAGAISAALLYFGQQQGTEKDKKDIIDTTISNIDSAENRLTNTIKSEADRVIDSSKGVFSKSLQYKDFIMQIEDLTRLMESSKTESEKIRYGNRLKTVEDQFEIFKKEVIYLAELFSRQEFDSEPSRRAKQLFNEGKFKQANDILSTTRLNRNRKELLSINEIEHQRHKQKLEDLKNAKQNLSLEFLIKAKLTAVEIDAPTRLAEVREYYESSIELDKNSENTFEYAQFLLTYHHSESISLLKEARLLYGSEVEDIDNTHRIIQIERLLADILRESNDFQAAIDHLTSAISSVQKLKTLDPNHDSALEMAILQMDLGIIFASINDKRVAKEYSDRSLNILRKGLSINAKLYKRHLALALDNFGSARIYKSDLSLQMLKESIQLYRELVIDDSGSIPFLAKALTNYGALAKQTNLMPEAYDSYEEALKIRQGLYNKNPFKAGEDLAYTLNNYGNLLRLTTPQKAKGYLFRSLEIRSQLAKLFPAKFIPYVAQTKMNIGLMYYRANDSEKANEAMMEVLTLIKPFVGVSPLAQELYQQASVSIEYFKASSNVNTKIVQQEFKRLSKKMLFNDGTIIILFDATLDRTKLTDILRVVSVNAHLTGDGKQYSFFFSVGESSFYLDLPPNIEGWMKKNDWKFTLFIGLQEEDNSWDYYPEWSPISFNVPRDSELRK